MGNPTRTKRTSRRAEGWPGEIEGFLINSQLMIRRGQS